MNAKIHEYQDLASEAETKLATMLSAAEYETLIGRVVRTMLFKQHEKPGVPVKRQELLDVMLGDDYKGHKASRKFPALVITLAQARCIATLGIEMVEVKRSAAVSAKRRGLGGQDEAPNVTQTYVLRSVLPTEVRRALVDDPADDQAQAFKLVVLSLIKLNGGSMPLDDLWRHLSHGLGVEPDDREHPAFGRPEDTLKELEKTRHLVRRQQHGATGAVTVLEWGEGADCEFPGDAITAFFEAEWAAAPGFDGGGGEGEGEGEEAE